MFYISVSEPTFADLQAALQLVETVPVWEKKSVDVRSRRARLSSSDVFL